MSDLKKPCILVTNDDGIDAPGIRFLTSVAASFGDVVVVAPSEGMSGMGHAITIKTPLRYRLLSPNGITMMAVVHGTPVDCVKVAIRKLLTQKPDLLLSGVNHGSNASVNTIYSGTMAAAFEGAMAGIPSVGFSLLDYDHKAPLEHLRPFLEQIIGDTIANGLPVNTCLNVNIPAGGETGSIKGIKLCRQALGYWHEAFEERLDPHQHPYIWMSGEFVCLDKAKDTDLYALEDDWISMVPMHFDFTAQKTFAHFKKWQYIDHTEIPAQDHETAQDK